MAEWIEYTGSAEQIEELKNNPNGYIVRDDMGVLSGRIRVAFDLDGVDILPFEYLICQPHPYDDLIKIWADTGCPVWVKVTKRNDWGRYINGVYYEPRAMVHEYLEPTTKPDWNIPGAEYSLTPFEA